MLTISYFACVQLAIVGLSFVRVGLMWRWSRSLTGTHVLRVGQFREKYVSCTIHAQLKSWDSCHHIHVSEIDGCVTTLNNDLFYWCCAYFVVDDIGKCHFTATSGVWWWRNQTSCVRFATCTTNLVWFFHLLCYWSCIVHRLPQCD